MTNDELLTKNMELAGVIRALRANAREDAKRLEELERERNELRAYLDSAHYATCNKELRQQRDEAIADRDIARLKALESDRAHDRMVGELEGVYKDRDELRKALMKIESIFVDGEDTYKDWLAMGRIADAAVAERWKELK